MTFLKRVTMATTFKAIIFGHHKKDDGSINVKIRVTHNRARKYIPTKIYVWPEDVTRSLKIKTKAITDDLDKLVKGYYKAVESIQGLDSRDIDDVVNIISRKDEVLLGFYPFVQTVIDNKAADGHKTTGKNYEVMMNSLKKYHPSTLYFSDINVAFLKDYEKWMKDYGTGSRGISLYLGLIRAVFNEAIKKYNDYENDIMLIKGSPFDKQRYKIPKEDTPEKRAIPVDKLRAIIDLPESGIYRVDIARDIFLLSFYLMGMNAVDMYGEDAKLIDGRIEYHRQKTRNRRTDNAFFSVLVPPEALPIMLKYKGKKRLFNFVDIYSSINNFSQALNIGLKTVGDIVGVKGLEFYAARHSWATIARNDCEIDKYTISEALNHVDPDMRVTDGYIEKNWTILDKTNRIVLDYIKLRPENK